MSRRGERALGAGFVLVGIAAAALATGFGQGTETGGPTARFFPVLLGLLTTGLGAAIALRAPSGAAAVTPPEGLLRALGTLVVLFAYLAVFERLGFLLATAPSLALLLVVFGERRWPVVASVAVVATAAAYAVFAVWLGVPLPAGLAGR
ncbi:MAG TPA: tripartite tricarboxylate transporter TctB family protein [Methylomirabilota bacterium]|nr:tripartite tricarboxylate transporter TctB family protein [Methylomirabilota bacterium]